MEILLYIYKEIKAGDFMTKLLTMAITFLIAIATVLATSYFSNKSSKHQQNILKLEHLKLLKDLIDKQAYELPAYRLIVEETMKSYVGYFINFDTIKVLFRTDCPSETLSLYKQFRFNIKKSDSIKEAIQYTHEITPWVFSVKQILFSILPFSLSFFCGMLTLILITGFSIEQSMMQLILTIMLFLASILSTFAFFIIGITFINQGLDYRFNQNQLDKMMKALNKSSKTIYDLEQINKKG